MTRLLICLPLLAGCAEDYTPLSFVARGDKIIVTGTIDHTSLSAFEEVIAHNPGLQDAGVAEHRRVGG